MKPFTTSFSTSSRRKSPSSGSDRPSAADSMGPVINEGAMRSILSYIDIGKKEGGLVAGGGRGEGDGYFVQPTVIADVDSKSRVFQEEIFGPVLAVTKAKRLRPCA